VGHQKSGHVLRRVVCLEIGGLISNQGVAHTVRLIKGIARKWFNESKDLTGHFVGELSLLGSGNKVNLGNPTVDSPSDFGYNCFYRDGASPSYEIDNNTTDNNGN